VVRTLHVRQSNKKKGVALSSRRTVAQGKVAAGLGCMECAVDRQLPRLLRPLDAQAPLSFMLLYFWPQEL
jgi:hypothetical protein